MTTFIVRLPKGFQPITQQFFDGENLRPYIVFFTLAPSRIRGQNEMVPEIPFRGIRAQIGGPFPLSPVKLTRNAQNWWASYLSARSNYNFSERVALTFLHEKYVFSPSHYDVIDYFQNVKFLKRFSNQ